jgi:hypothetical protein
MRRFEDINPSDILTEEEFLHFEDIMSDFSIELKPIPTKEAWDKAVKSTIEDLDRLLL